MIKNFLSQNFVKNKNIIFGFLLSMLVLGFSVMLSSLIYQPKKMVKRGFEVEIKVATNNVVKDIGGIKVSNLNDLNPVSTLKVIDIAEMIKNADARAGEKVFKKCSTCHTVKEGGKNKIGPNLYAIIGKKKASISGFSYSKAMQSKGGNWTLEDLNAWLINPRDFAPGTKMSFAGLKKDKDRANVIAYLKQQGAK
jgi:cytochrome c